MVYNILGKAYYLILELLSSKKVKDRIALNMETLLTDDQVVQEVLLGMDEKQPVIIALTNKRLLVIGDTLIHDVKKEEILDMFSTRGVLFSHLIEVSNVGENTTVYFKVFTKKSITKIKDWLK